MRCGCLATVFAVCQWATQQLQSSLVPHPGCLTPSVRQLSASSTYSSSIKNINEGARGTGGPPSPEEFFGMSWLSKSNKFAVAQQQQQQRTSLSRSGTILAGDPVRSTRPTFILYVGVPEHSTELQCQLCSNPRLIKALERDGYVFLGACHKHDCDAFPSPRSADATVLMEEPESESDNNNNATFGRRRSNNNKVFTPKASNFFYWSSSVFEPSSSNTTLAIVPHTLEMSLAHGRRRNIPQLEIDFMLELDSVRESGQSALLIHPGASVWSAKHIRCLSAFLNLHWNVHVLVGPYQPLLEYLSEISYRFVQEQYLESRTFKLWPGQKRDGRTGFDSLERSVINDVRQLVEENLAHGMHPMEMAYANYARHFGRNRTHCVIPSLSDAGLLKSTVRKSAIAAAPPPPPPVSVSAVGRDHLLDHLLCDMLGLDRTCRVVKEQQQQLRTQNQEQSPVEVDADPLLSSAWTRRLADTWDQIQVDAVAVAAHDRHVEALALTTNDRYGNGSSSSLSPPPIVWTRRTVREDIVLRLEQLGQSPHRSWPRICLDADQVDALTEYSHVLHDRILQRYRESRGEDATKMMNQTSAAGAASAAQMTTTILPYVPGMESFVTDVLLCYVDTEAVFRDDGNGGSWALWFQGLVPVGGGGIGNSADADATTDPIVAEE
jgi:hypothetical protein